MGTPTLSNIEPALGMLGEYAKVAKGTTAMVHKMRQTAIYADGSFPAKVKVLAAMLWSVSARCEPCVKHYAAKAKEYGATDEEVGEFLALASAMGGCVGETWALKAYAAYKEDGADAGVCCT
jgi:AhpD family alkylhydroperoxidase